MDRLAWPQWPAPPQAAFALPTICDTCPSTHTPTRLCYPPSDSSASSSNTCKCEVCYSLYRLCRRHTTKEERQKVTSTSTRPTADTVKAQELVYQQEGERERERAQKPVYQQERFVMGLFSNRVSRDELQPGDHVYSWRFAYSYAHHGIYVGDGKVIHFTRGQGQELGTGTALDSILSGFGSSPSHAYKPCNQCSSNSDRNGVLLSCVDCFLCGYPLYRFEYGENTAVFLAKARGGTCTLAVSDSPEKVVHRAEYLLENGFGVYHIFRKNCEDFAMYCKTGLLIVEGNSVGISGQACSSLGAPLAAMASSPLGLVMAEPWGLVALSAGMYCVSRYASDLRNRWDVTKVPVESLVSKVGPAVPA